MRTLILLALLFCASVNAQETYSIGSNANNVATVSGVIAAQNGDTCERYSLVRTCTQAQACTAASAPGGSSCTASQARGAGVRIFPLTQAGREEFLMHRIVAPKFTELVADHRAESRRSFCESWNASNQTAKDSACTALGASAGCNPGC